MKCPICGAAELIRDTRDVPYIYKGETTTIADVTADYCSSCGEAIMDREQGNRYSDAVGLFQKRVNAVTAEMLAKASGAKTGPMFEGMTASGSILKSTVLESSDFLGNRMLTDEEQALLRKDKQEVIQRLCSEVISEAQGSSGSSAES